MTEKLPVGWTEVSFTKESWTKLKAAYEAARKSGKPEFVFEGKEYVTTFAKYFIEFHDPKFQE